MQGIHGGTAIVTGAGSGIGRATAIRFADAGANVVVADIDRDGGTETVDHIEDAGGEARFIETDVADADDVAAMVDEAIEAYGSLNFAHNNAGIGDHVESFVSMTEQDWDRTLDINLRGVWLCMRAELEAMEPGSAIVNTSSTAGLLGYPSAPQYSAAKHGVLGLTKSAAFEFAERDIRVNAVCPGIIDTNIGDGDTDISDRVERVTPMKRIGDPGEVADVVVRLCSDDASFVTGIEVPVDGGMTAGRVWERV